MHKIFENDDLMMYFKKRYCHCCGKALQRKRTERVVQRGDPDHIIYCTVGRTYKPYGDILVIGKEYYCPACDKSFSCDEQAKVIKAQKYHKRNIVTDEEIKTAKSNSISASKQNALNLRWFLLIPILGGLISMFAIFNGTLSEATKSRDGSKILLSSVLTFVGVALIAKLILSMFNSDFTSAYNTILMLIPSALSFNVPVLFYINNTFKNGFNT